MTIREVSSSIMNLSVDNTINGEQMSLEWLERYLTSMFRPQVHLKLGNRLMMTVLLPDGEWYFTVNHYGNGNDEYDFTIPETREQEQRIKEALG